MKANYDNWRKRLECVAAGIKPKDWPVKQRATTDAATADDCGFYRLPIKERTALKNGAGTKWVTSGYHPVAMFVDGSKLVCAIGDKFVYEQDANEAFLSFVSHPISEEWYRAVAERFEPWPDNPAPPPEIPAANREVAKDDNAAPEVLTDKDHAAGIDNAIAAAVKVIKTEEDAAQALGSKNRIAELRLAADKAGKALYGPPYRDYKRLHGLWSPMVAKADTAEKSIQRAILTFREQERQRIAREQAEADAKQHEIDDANERAAQRSIAAGEPEQPPEVVEIIAPTAPAPILPTYGTRKLKEEVKTFLDKINDFDKVYAYFKDAEEVKIFLTTLATAAVRAGRAVPGTTTRTGLI